MLRLSLLFMKERLLHGKPREVGSKLVPNWYLFTDASYEPKTKTGGIGAVLVDDSGALHEWFGIQLDDTVCRKFGAERKDTIIYELEMAAAVFAFHIWGGLMSSGLQLWFGDNDSVRFAFIRGSAVGKVASHLLAKHLELEAKLNLSTWYARVATEANISDFPSRNESHSWLKDCSDISTKVSESWRLFCKDLERPTHGFHLG